MCIGAKGGFMVTQLLLLPKILKPASINRKTLEFYYRIAPDIVQFDKIEIAKKKLVDVIKSEYCSLPDFMTLIPKGTNEEETVKLLADMFESSKFFFSSSLVVFTLFFAIKNSFQHYIERN